MLVSFLGKEKSRFSAECFILDVPTLGFLGHLVFCRYKCMTGPQKPTQKTFYLSRYSPGRLGLFRIFMNASKLVDLLLFCVGFGGPKKGRFCSLHT